ncbi:MAG TPA: hypothetical protein VGG10_19275 [Rhizomicrobium sp.]|jgi:hypothetical protein
MPEAAKSLEKRKRGGQPGNQNRVVHGRYTQKRAAWRVELCAFRRKSRALAILVRNVLKARAALKRRRGALAARASLVAAVLCDPERAASAQDAHMEGWRGTSPPLNCHGPPCCEADQARSDPPSCAPSAQFA